jgi:hypothetical protein
LRNNTGFRFLLDQISDGKLKWADVRDDFDTVVLIDDNDADAQKSMAKIEEAIATGTPITSQMVSFMAGRKETMANIIDAFPEEKQAIER